MKALSVIAVLLLAFNVGATETDVKTVQLENGEALVIKKIQPSRILPHAFHDQALSSIPGIYPDSQILAKRRVGYLRKNPAVLYSLLCYKESNKQERVTISGVITYENHAWSFDSKVEDSSFPETLILIFETLNELPFDTLLRPGVESDG